MMRKYTYNHGLPFNSKLGSNIDALSNRIEINKASLIITDGSIGEGKTTLAIHIADYINKKHGLPPVDLSLKHHPQLAVGGAQFQRNLHYCYKKGLPVVIYDEAGDFSRRGALTQFNAMLNRTFETFRAFNIIVILVLPSFDTIDNSLFDKGIPRLLLNCYDRNPRYGNFRGYSLYLMYYLRQKMKKLTVKRHAYSMVYPNFYGQFLDLEPSRSKQLDRISTKAKIEISKIQSIKMEGLVSYSEIAQKLNKSIVWTKRKMSKLNVKHKRLIDRKKYFHKDIIDRLTDLEGEK